MTRLDFQLINITDRGLSVDITLDINDLKPDGVAPLPMGALTVRGSLTPMIGQYLFKGTLTGAFAHSCDRCLEPAEIPVELPVLWTFDEGEEGGGTHLDGEDEDGLEPLEDEAYGLFTFSGTTIELARPVWDEVCLALPAKFICRETCRGLCPVCGGNRNTAPCTCEEIEIEETPVPNSGFAGLKDMFPDLPE